MANNYSITSFTLYPKELTKPFKLGKLGQTLIHLFTGEYPSENLTTLTTDIDEYGFRTLEDVFTTLIEDYSLDDTNCFNFNGLLPQLTPYFNKETLGELDRTFSSVKIDSDESVALEDLLHLCFEEEDSNFGSFYSETGYWCSKPRHGEFGGYSHFVSDDFRQTKGTGELAYLGSSLPEDYIPKYIQKQTLTMLQGIKNKHLQQEIAKQLIQQIQHFTGE